MLRWRDRARDWLAWWPLRDRLLTLAAVVMVGFIAYSLVARDDGRSARSVAEVTSTTVPPALDAATSPSTVPAAEQPTPTTAPAPPVTDPPPADPPAAEPPPTTEVPTPPTTVRPSATTAPPTTGRAGPFCGFVPGSIIDIDLNGQPSGRQLADAKGCVTVTR